MGDPNPLFCFKFVYIDPTSQRCAVLQYGLCNHREGQTNIAWAGGERGSVSSKFHIEFLSEHSGFPISFQGWLSTRNLSKSIPTAPTIP